MNSKFLIKRAVVVVTLLFAVFSGFLGDFAPPEEVDATFAVGFGSFIVLIVLFIASALARERSSIKRRRRWLMIAIIFFAASIASGLVYKRNFDWLIFAYPPESTEANYIAGTKLTPEAQRYQVTRAVSQAQLVAKFGGMQNRHRVWTPESLYQAKMILVVNYLVLVLSLASTIFCLTEVVLVEVRKRSE